MTLVASPERRLIAAIIVSAARDLKHKLAERRYDAQKYFASENFEFDCDVLGFDPGAMRRHILENHMSKHILTDDDIRALHHRYLTSEISIEQLAAEAGVSPSTIWRSFKRLGLTTTDAILELNRLLTDVDNTLGRRVRITLDIELITAPGDPS